jgi:phage-related minor tail protein
MKKNTSFTLFLITISAVGVFAQTPTASPSMQTKTQVSSTPVGLETILSEAEKQATNYQEEFKNLLATETKTFEEYDKNGNLKDQTNVESNFFVYQSARNKDLSSELRNVTKVDGKLVPDSQARADRFLAELEKTTTAEKELEKIQDEGSRYDKTLIINGLTLSEAISLDDTLRSNFDFKLVGSENYQGREVYVITYQQTKKSPLITINEKASNDKRIKAGFDISLPGSLKKNDVFLRGKLWIDKQNFQIWREERQLAVQTVTPIVAMETILEYQPSEFGILVPKKISLQSNSIKKNSKENEFTAVKDTKVIYDYSKFRKFNVDVKVLDDN